MATLVNCLECGKNVSSEAPRCPHCTTRYPIGVKCIVCCKYLKRSEALKIAKEYGGAENRVSVKFFHRSCHQQVNQIRLGRGRTSCPVCKHSIEFETASSVSCRNCGQNFLTNLADPSFAFCCYCEFRLNTSLEVAIKDTERQFLDGWITETTYAHKICYTQERQAAEQKRLRDEHLLTLKFKKSRSKVLRADKKERIIKTIGTALLYGLVIGSIFGGLGAVTFNWIFKLGFNWQSTALFGFLVIFLLTIFAILLAGLLKLGHR